MPPRDFSRWSIGFAMVVGLALLAGATPRSADLVDRSYDALLKDIAGQDAKFTLVDCWASWCGPCKENYPHLKEMDSKYREQGLRVIALSFDGGLGEPEYDDKEIAAAKKFINAQKAAFDNFRLNEERDQMFEKFDISTIPAVFVYDEAGKLIKRYTWDDPNNQFTYEQVEKDVAGLLSAQP